MSHLVREGLLHKVSIGEDDGGNCIRKNGRREASRMRIGHGAGGRDSRARRGDRQNPKQSIEGALRARAQKREGRRLGEE